MPILAVDEYLIGAGDGQPGHLTLPYNDLVVPAGIEAVLEYNGLFLNIEKNVDRYKIKDIDGIFDADVRDARQPNTEDDGETLQASFMGGRTLVLNGTIRTYSLGKLRGMLQALRTAFADISQERPLHFRTGNFATDHFIMCKKFASSTSSEQQTNQLWERDFQITLRASNLRFLSFYQNSISVYPTPTTVMSTSPIFIAINRGNYWAQPTIRIWGPCNSVTLLNAATEATFTVSGITQNYVEWNTAKRTLFDQSGNPVWGVLDDDADKFYLQGTGQSQVGDTWDNSMRNAWNPTGENGIFYTGDSPRIDFFWYDSWI